MIRRALGSFWRAFICQIGLNRSRAAGDCQFVRLIAYTDKFDNDPNNARSCNSIGAYYSLDDWFPNARQIQLSEDVIGLGNYGKTLTVLFTDEEVDGADDDIGEWKPRFERRR